MIMSQTLPISRFHIYLSTRYFTVEPHIAGSLRQYELAVHISNKWKEYGFDEVEMPEYRVLLSLPREDQPNNVEVITNGSVSLTIHGKLQVKTLHYANLSLNYLIYFLLLDFVLPHRQKHYILGNYILRRNKNVIAN